MHFQTDVCAMKIFEWTEGRRKSKYNKLPLLLLGYGKPMPFIGFLDCYILKFGPGGRVNPHQDPVIVEQDDGTNDYYAHHRLNIIVKKSRQGGEFVCFDGPHKQFLNGRIHFFRSDLCIHSVTEVTEGTRYVLSVGWGNFTKPYKTGVAASD